MWDLGDRLDYVLFEQEVEVEPFKRGEIVATRVDGEEKSGTYLGMSGSGRARVRGNDGVIYHMDPKVLYLPAEERRKEKRREYDRSRRARIKAALQATKPKPAPEPDIDENDLEEVRSYFFQRATHDLTPKFEKAYAERMLELIESGITKDKVKALIRAAKKERIRQHSYEKRGDRRAAAKYRALERSIFHLEQLL